MYIGLEYSFRNRDTDDNSENHRESGGNHTRSGKVVYSTYDRFQLLCVRAEIIMHFW